MSEAAAQPKRSKVVPIVITVVAIALLLFIYFQGKKTGKLKEQLNSAKPEKLPNNGSGIPANWSPNGLVAKLHKVLDGVDWFMSNDDKKSAYGELASLTKDQITAVYNAFNKAYGEVENGKYTYTLYNWISDDSGDDSKVRALAALEMAGLQ